VAPKRLAAFEHRVTRAIGGRRKRAAVAVDRGDGTTSIGDLAIAASNPNTTGRVAPNVNVQFLSGLMRPQRPREQRA